MFIVVQNMNHNPRNLIIKECHRYCVAIENDALLIDTQ